MPKRKRKTTTNTPNSPDTCISSATTTHTQPTPDTSPEPEPEKGRGRGRGTIGGRGRVTRAVRDRIYVNEYTRNGGNGTQAMLQVSPHMTPASAATESTRMLRRPQIRDMIDRALESRGISVDWVTGRYVELAQDQDDRRVALQATDRLARLAGVEAAVAQETQTARTTARMSAVAKQILAAVQSRDRIVDVRAHSTTTRAPRTPQGSGESAPEQDPQAVDTAGVITEQVDTGTTAEEST